MSTYNEAVAARQQIIDQFFEEPNCTSVLVAPAPPPENYVVQVNCTSAINNLPTEVNGVTVKEVLGPVSPGDDDLHEGALGTYIALQDGDAGALLAPPNTYIATLAAPQSFSLPRAFVTSGELRVANSGTGAVTLQPFSGDTIALGIDLVLSAGESATLLSDGSTNWVRF